MTFDYSEKEYLQEMCGLNTSHANIAMIHKNSSGSSYCSSTCGSLVTFLVTHKRESTLTKQGVTGTSKIADNESLVRSSSKKRSRTTNKIYSEHILLIFEIKKNPTKNHSAVKDTARHFNNKT